MERPSYLKELYDSCMWIEEQHLQRAAEIQAERQLSDEELRALAEEHAPALKQTFAKIFTRMGDKRAYYSIPRRIFPVGEESELVVRCKYRFQRLVGSFKAIVVPYYNYDCPLFGRYTPWSTVVQAQDGALRIPFRFEREDLYTVNIFYLLDGEELPFLSADVYALEEDLYACNYYKADLHMHTTWSDGYEPPELVVASARERGMDVIAVTDHNGFSGSVAARERAEEMGAELTVILGEEYSLEYSPMHILALGTERPIDRKYLTRQALDLPETQALLRAGGGGARNAEMVACIQTLLDQVTKMGGVSILAHPYWKPIMRDGSRIDTPEEVFIELGKDRRFAGIEVVSGSPESEFGVSQLQASLARTILGSFTGVPIIGITDAHCYTTDKIAGKHFTVLFARSRERESVLDALRKGRTVAVEMLGGEPLCFGEHRLVKLAKFLVKEYFPDRDEAARREALAMKEEHLLRRD